MSYQDRKKIYSEIEKERKNPLIVYVTSIRPNFSAKMAEDAIPFIINQINLIDSKVTEVDFMIISNGGDPITALRINSILRERFKKINVLIPYVAYSAATIFSLGADSIIMGKYSNLGPVDPQITAQKKDSNGGTSNLQFGSEDLRYFIKFVKEDIGVRKEKNKLKACENLITDVGGNTIGFAKRSQQLSLYLSEKLMSEHGYNRFKIKKISKRLNSSYHHGYAVSRAEAIDMGLKVERPSNKIESLMWELWKDFEKEMKCDIAFDPMSEIMNNPLVAQKLSNVPVVNIPANLPPQGQQAVLQSIISKVQFATQSTIQVPVLLGCIESINLGYNISTVLHILAWRNFDMQIGINLTTSSSGWNKI